MLRESETKRSGALADPRYRDRAVLFQTQAQPVFAGDTLGSDGTGLWPGRLAARIAPDKVAMIIPLASSPGRLNHSIRPPTLFAPHDSGRPANCFNIHVVELLPQSKAPRARPPAENPHCRAQLPAARPAESGVSGSPHDLRSHTTSSQCRQSDSAHLNRRNVRARARRRRYIVWEVI
jgi:hypothetical protein